VRLSRAEALNGLVRESGAELQLVDHQARQPRCARRSEPLTIGEEQIQVAVVVDISGLDAFGVPGIVEGL
jgi:hypothetical protein